jgi:sigma-B regulation protein RsbU (phosphoserine phosphatase)
MDAKLQKQDDTGVLDSLESFLLEVTDAVNATLDLDTLLNRVSELVQRVIKYEIFAILLLNERTQTLRIRFQKGHPPEVASRIRVKVGQGITGLAAQRGEAVLVSDVAEHPQFISSGVGARSELAIPLISKNKIIGIIDLESPVPGYFNVEHQKLLTLVASRIAVAIENARLYSRVARQAKSLALLNEISRDITSILNLDALLDRIGKSIARIIDYQMFSILLLDPGGTHLVHRYSQRFNENIQLKHDIPLGRGLVGYAAEHNEPVLAPDVTEDPRYIPLNPETMSELCIPLVYKSKVIGVLDLENTRRGYYNEDHVRLLVTLGAQIAVAIENATLYERLALQEHRLEQDFALARELQLRLLPQGMPKIRNAEIAARFTPARTIGGDLYDWLTYSGGDVTALVVGDVSGKGAPAAIYAALVSGIMRSIAPEEPGPARMLSGLNLSLAERPTPGHFVSMLFVLWDSEQMRLQLANSGMPRPVRCRAGKAEAIDATGIPAGLFSSVQYDELTFEAQPGDLFVFFSDGITEATNVEGEEFGEARLYRIIEQNATRSAVETVSAIFAAVNEFVGEMDAFDDQTVVALKVKDPTKK